MPTRFPAVRLPRRALALLLVLLPALMGPRPTPAAPASRPAAGGELDRLARCMIGSYSSAAQAAADTSYFDVRLEMVRIWPGRSDGYWLYVEQAMKSALEKPYRQRVYHLTGSGDTLFTSAIFTLPTPQRFVGAGQRPELLAALTPDSLLAREGCAVTVRRVGPAEYAGGTHARDCPSDLRGAAWATSEVRITETELQSWDRGFDREGRQVWGVVKGPYRFRKAVAPAR